MSMTTALNPIWVGVTSVLPQTQSPNSAVRLWWQVFNVGSCLLRLCDYDSPFSSAFSSFFFFFFYHSQAVSLFQQDWQQRILEKPECDHQAGSVTYLFPRCTDTGCPGSCTPRCSSGPEDRMHVVRYKELVPFPPRFSLQGLLIIVLDKVGFWGYPSFHNENKTHKHLKRHKRMKIKI